jgi:hypothetical protein
VPLAVEGLVGLQKRIVAAEGIEEPQLVVGTEEGL